MERDQAGLEKAPRWVKICGKRFQTKTCLDLVILSHSHSLSLSLSLSLDMSLFFKLFDAQIKPMLYASEIWGMLRLTAIETAHLFACKRLLCISNKTPNHMVYSDTGRYPLYIESTLSSLRYWLKLRRMPTE